MNFNSREENLMQETEFHAKFLKLRYAASSVPGSLPICVLKVLEAAEMNAYETDYAQDHLQIDEHFWRVVDASIRDLLSDHSICPLKVRNWFALQGVVA